MAYNFPVGYQPYYQYQAQPNMFQSQSQPQASAQGGIIWVQGEAGAKSYLVAPNTTVQLWDSENQVIYLKSADASGMPSMKILDYKIREATQSIPQTQALSQPHVSADYVTREELNAFEAQIREQIAGLTRKEGEPDE